MTNHPNRSRAKNPASNPTPQAIRDKRGNLNLTQTEAAKLVYSSLRAWQQWESGERRMHPGLWELFVIKTSDTPAEYLDAGGTRIVVF